MSNRALEEWSRILVVFGNERLLSEQTVLVGRLGSFSTKRDLCSLVEPAWSWKRTESGLVVTTNSKLEHEECCFQRIPLQDIGKLLKIVWKTVVVGRDWVSLPQNAIYDHLGIVTTYKFKIGKLYSVWKTLVVGRGLPRNARLQSGRATAPGACPL